MKNGFKTVIRVVTLVLFVATISVNCKEERRRRVLLRSRDPLRNSRQTPAIPALYSAPKPELPALYSAPKAQKPEYSAPNGRGSAEENQVDFEGGTTESSNVGQTQTTSQPDLDDGVSEEYQIAGVTSVPNDDSTGQNEFGTESPQDSYAPRRGGKVTPDVAYGPPRSTGQQDTKELTFDTSTRRPLDQQQIENTPFQHQIQVHVVSPHQLQQQERENQINPNSNYGPPAERAEVSNGGQYLPPQSAQLNQPRPNFREESQNIAENSRNEFQGSGQEYGQYAPQQREFEEAGGYPTQPELRYEPQYANQNIKESPEDGNQKANDVIQFQPRNAQQQNQGFSGGYFNEREEPQGYSGNGGYEQQFPEPHRQQQIHRQPETPPQPEIHRQPETRRQPETYREPETRRQPEAHRRPQSYEQPNVPESRQTQTSEFGGYETQAQFNEPRQQQQQQFDQQSANTHPSQQQYQIPPNHQDSFPAPQQQQQQQQQGYSNPHEKFPDSSSRSNGQSVQRSEASSPQQQQEQEQSGGAPLDGKSEGRYLPPGTRITFNRMEDRPEDLEGLNGNIVDAALLRRVQQIIEDHERQQKSLANKNQRDNEAAFTNTNTNTNAQRTGGGYQEGLNYPEGNPVQFQPHSFPSPQQNREEPSQLKNFRGNSGNNIENERSEERPRGAEPFVEYQKALLSTHFTETAPLDRDSRTYLPPAPQSPYPQSRGFYESPAPANLQSQSNPTYPQPDPAYRQVYVKPAYQERQVEAAPQPPTYNPQETQQVQDGSGYQDNREVQLGTALIVANPQQQQQFQQQSQAIYNPQGPSEAEGHGITSPVPVALYGSPNSFPEPEQQFFVGDNSVAPGGYEGQSGPPTNFGFDQSIGNSVPRPVYGIPLAPVIGLDSNNNLKVVEEGQREEVGGQGQTLSNFVTLPVHDFSPSSEAHFHRPTQVFYGRNRRRVARVVRVLPASRTPLPHHL